MTRALLLITSLLLLAGCGHRSDAVIRKNLPGTWHMVTSPEDRGSRSLFRIAPNGDFTNQVISSQGVHIVEVAGTFQVQDGYLIGAVIQQDSQLPHVSRAKIYQADESEMVIGYDGTTNRYTLKKDTE